MNWLIDTLNFIKLQCKDIFHFRLLISNEKKIKGFKLGNLLFFGYKSCLFVLFENSSVVITYVHTCSLF